MSENIHSPLEIQSITRSEYMPDEVSGKLPALATRLGVEPCSNTTGKWLIRISDGRKYDIIDLLNKLLDRMDAASEHQS